MLKASTTVHYCPPVLILSQANAVIWSSSGPSLTVLFLQEFIKTEHDNLGDVDINDISEAEIRQVPEPPPH